MRLFIRNHPARAGALAGFLQQLSSMGVALVLVPVAIRVLGSDLAGIWFAFQGLVAMLALLDIGFGFAVSRQTAYTMGTAESKKDLDGFLSLPPGFGGVSCLFHIMSKVYRGMAISILIIGTSGFEIIKHFGNLIPTQDLEPRLCWYALVLSASLQILGLGKAAFLNGMGSIFQTKAVACVLNLVTGALVVTAAASGLGLVGMGLSFLFVSLLQWLALCLMVPSTIKFPNSENQAWLKANGGFWRQLNLLSKSALPVGGILVFASLIYTIQPTIAGVMLGAESVAAFYVAQKIAGSLNLAVMQFCLPQLPFLTRSVGAGDFKTAFAKITQLAFVGSIAFGFSGIIFYFLSPIAARILMDDQAYLEDPALFVLSIDFIILGISSLTAQIVLASGRNPFVISTIITGILSLALSLLLSPHLGLLGLTLAPLIAGIASNYHISLLKFIELRNDYKNGFLNQAVY